MSTRGTNATNTKAAVLAILPTTATTEPCDSGKAALGCRRQKLPRLHQENIGGICLRNEALHVQHDRVRGTDDICLDLGLVRSVLWR